MANRCRRQLSFVLILFLSACATPDLQSFATQTANLANAVNAEQATVSGKFEEIKILAEAGVAEGWAGTGTGFDPKTYASLGQQYDKTAMAVSEIVLAATNYSQALANLAASSRDGKEAVEKLTTSLGGVTSALSLTNPLALISSGAKDILTEIVGIVRLMQVQNSLEKVMAVVEDRKLARKLSTAIQKIYRDVDSKIYRNLARVEKGMKKKQFGESRREAAKLAAKTLATRHEMIANIFNKILNKDSKDPKCNNPDKTNATLESLKNFDQNCFNIPDDLEPDDERLVALVAAEKELTAELARIDAWRDLHLTQSNNILAAVKLWADEHRSVYEALKECGGFRFLKPACGQLTFANLGVAAKRIESLAQGLKK